MSDLELARELRAMLEQVERGELGVEPIEGPADTFIGPVTFQLSNGYRLVVYNDSGEWDHVDSFYSPDGRHIVPWGFEDPEAERLVTTYRPPADVEQGIYGFEG